MTKPVFEERFQNLLEEHKKILYKICNLYCKNRDDREDLAQEIAIQLWRSFPSFDERCRFSTWMYRIALNVAISFYRREDTRTRYIFSDNERLLHAVDETASEPRAHAGFVPVHRIVGSVEPGACAAVSRRQQLSRDSGSTGHQ